MQLRHDNKQNELVFNGRRALLCTYKDECCETTGNFATSIKLTIVLSFFLISLKPKGQSTKMLLGRVLTR